MEVATTIFKLDSANANDSLCSEIYWKFETKKEFATREETTDRGFRVARSHPPLVPTRPESLLFKRMECIEQEQADSKIQCTKSIKLYSGRRFTIPPWQTVAKRCPRILWKTSYHITEASHIWTSHRPCASSYSSWRHTIYAAQFKTKILDYRRS